MPLSAAEVLAGGLAVKNAASAGSIWGNSVAISKPPVAGKASPAPTPSKSRPAQVDANPLDSDPTACAASALLGLQKQEPVSLALDVIDGLLCAQALAIICCSNALRTRGCLTLVKNSRHACRTSKWNSIVASRPNNILTSCDASYQLDATRRTTATECCSSL